MNKTLKKLARELAIDSSRVFTLRAPFCWYVKSQDLKELNIWMHSFGLAEAITDQISQINFGDSPVYYTATVAMRRFSIPGYWIMVIFGFWSDDKEHGYRGVLAICKDGDEESFGDQWLKETREALCEDVELWSLKHNQPVTLAREGQDAEYKRHWFPAS